MLEEEFKEYLYSGVTVSGESVVKVRDLIEIEYSSGKSPKKLKIRVKRLLNVNDPIEIERLRRKERAYAIPLLTSSEEDGGITFVNYKLSSQEASEREAYAWLKFVEKGEAYLRTFPKIYFLFLRKGNGGRRDALDGFLVREYFGEENLYSSIGRLKKHKGEREFLESTLCNLVGALFNAVGYYHRTFKVSHNDMNVHNVVIDRGASLVEREGRVEERIRIIDWETCSRLSEDFREASPRSQPPQVDKVRCLLDVARASLLHGIDGRVCKKFLEYWLDYERDDEIVATVVKMLFDFYSPLKLRGMNSLRKLLRDRFKLP